MSHQTGSSCVAIIGAGTMGAGIAQVAIMGGWSARLMDVDSAKCKAAIEEITKRINRLVEKERLTAEQAADALDRLDIAHDPDQFGACDLVIEAIIEDLSLKTKVLLDVVPALSDRAIIATNTSSLSISAIGQSIGCADRTVGMHFFNPAPLLPLVEVIAGRETDDTVIERVIDIAHQWNKTPVRVSDTPGFIVNRVARPFYLESWRVLADGLAGVDDIDRILKQFGGFRMGPFELTDLIGQDVNVATTESVWSQLGKPSRLKPSPMQQQLVEDGHLGRKTGRGAYVYEGDDEPEPAITVERKPFVASDPLLEAVERFVEKATDQRGADFEHYVFARVLIAIINEAAWAQADGVASGEDIDTAMKLGTNYPRGPLEWSRQIGRERCARLLDQLREKADDDRFVAPDALTGSAT